MKKFDKNTTMIDSGALDEILVARDREKSYIASLTEAAAKLGYELVATGKGISHPLAVDGPITLSTVAVAKPRENKAKLKAFADGFRLDLDKKKQAKPLKCSKCDRTFALPLHLGRHMTTMHVPKGRTHDRSVRGR
jgi:hypothetical protein